MGGVSDVAGRLQFEGAVTVNVVCQKKTILLPLTSPSLRATETFFLERAEHLSGEPVKIPPSCIYYLNLTQVTQNPNLESWRALKHQYEEDVGQFSFVLMSAIPKNVFEAIACVPSEAPEFLHPYRDVFLRLNSGAVDLSFFLHGSEETIGENASDKQQDTSVKFDPPSGFAPKNRVLILDDVLHTGKSATAVMNAISACWPSVLGFSLACPLWMVHLDR